MKIFIIFICYVSFISAKPQGVSPEEVFGSDNARYGNNNNENLDQSVVDDVFGTTNNGDVKANDGSYTDNGDPKVSEPQTDGTYTNDKNAPQTEGTYTNDKNAPQTDGTYTNDKNAPQTDGTNTNDEKNAPQTDGTYSDNEESTDDAGKAAASNDGTYTTVGQIVDKEFDKCSFYANKGYSCVPYYNCEDGEIITDGGGLIDIRSGFGAVLDPASSKCEGYLEVCCKHADFTTTTTRAPVTRATTRPTPAPYVSQCGRRNSNGIGVRIQNVNGSTQIGEWPHMCAVLEKKVISGETINLYVGGASLISPGIILTAAHIVAKLQADNVKIRCGEWDTQQNIEEFPHAERDVEHITMNPLFNPRNLQNDFALLFLKQDFQLTPNIDTICLPDNDAGTFSYNPRDCVATGWGKNTFGKEGEYQVIMKQVEMDTVNATECERRLRRTRLGINFKLHDSFMCAGGEADRDTCEGDGGGPLVCPLISNNGYVQYAQAGIIAWGIDCGVDGNPGVYANVADGLCFIQFATQCHLGNDIDRFGIKGCNFYIQREEDEINDTLFDLNFQLDGLNKNDTDYRSTKRSLKRRIRKKNFELKGLKELDDSCIDVNDNNGYGTNDDDTDLSGFARTSGTVSGTKEQLKDEETSEEEINTEEEIN